MKRLVPLWITALGGFVLLIAFFIPSTQGWGEIAAIWFDILAAIAFILGGGNLMKIHLSKISDRGKGWGYSVVTIVSFLLMLFVGLVKFGAPPAPKLEYRGELFSKLPMESLPQQAIASVPGSIYHRADDGHLPASASRQLSEDNGQLVWHGWMTSGQKSALIDHAHILKWQCDIQKLYEASQPPDLLKGQLLYYPNYSTLSFKGQMTAEQRDLLKSWAGDEAWTTAVDDLYTRSQLEYSIDASVFPPLLDPAEPTSSVTYSGSTLSIVGPMSDDQRATLLGGFPKIRPMTDAQIEQFMSELSALGSVSEKQDSICRTMLRSGWQVSQLQAVLDAAGAAEEVPRTACECYEDQQSGATEIARTSTVGVDQSLNPQQVQLIEAFVADPTMDLEQLKSSLAANGLPFKKAQADAVDSFFSTVPSIGVRNKALAYAMMQLGEDESGNLYSLNQKQRDFLLADYRQEVTWNQSVSRLYVDSNPVKFGWSGEYRAMGGAFWWLYEYMFKPLQATIFAMLAFYVASAAFRAFRAKNFEAILLLGTAFIILLGRTFAGVALTGWMPEALSGLKIENLTVTIMKVFNTAGNRAIMIGIALGIASTSLKVLLGVDRSYLGKGED